MIIKTKYGEMTCTVEFAERLLSLLNNADVLSQDFSFGSTLRDKLNNCIKESTYGKIYYHGFVIVIKDKNPYDKAKHECDIYKCQELIYDNKDYVNTIVGTLEYVLNYIDTYLIL